MKLTTKSRYAVRALFDIAYHSGGLQTSIKDISQRQRISPRYLEQIFSRLKKAGIVGSKRGPRGGYFLRSAAKEITVYQVLEATEGPIELVFCVSEDETGPCSGPGCNLKDQCVAGPLWKGMGEQLAQVFRKTSIQDLCDRAVGLGLERTLDSRFMYYI